MKKILAILLAVVMTLSMITPVFAASYSDTAENDYEAAIEHLSGLGVINGYEDGSFQPEKVVTRAEMAKLLVVCLGLEQGATLLNGESKFNDVATSHWAIGYINIAAAQGLIKGYDDGSFKPDVTVNYAEACTMCLRALGYGELIEKAGQWPANYLAKANTLEIFDDVKLDGTTVGANRGSIAQMVWNMVKTEMWDITSINETNGASSTKTGDTMFQTYFTKYCTKVTTASGNDVLEPNYVDDTLDNITIIDSETISLAFTGIDLRVKGINPLMLKDVEIEAIYTKDEKLANVFNAVSLVIHSEDFSVGRITKYDATNNKITVNGNVYDIAVATKTGVAPAEDVYVKLLFNDNGKVTDVFGMASNDSYVIKEVKTDSNNKVTFKKLTGIGGTALSIEDSKDDVIFFNTDGTVMDKKDIKAGMLVEKVANTKSVEAAYLTTGDAYIVTSNLIDGTASKIELAAAGAIANTKIIVNDKAYKVVNSANMKTYIKYDGETEADIITAAELKALAGKSISFMVNQADEILYIEADENTKVNNYGIITKILNPYITEDGDSIFKVKLLTLDGEEVTYELYNFTTKQSVALAATYALKDLIKYELKDGKIAIDSDQTVEIASAPITAVDKTSKMLAGPNVVYTANTQFVQFTGDVTATQIENAKMNSFSIDNLATGVNYFVTKDTDNYAEYVIYDATATSLAADSFAILTSNVGTTGEDIDVVSMFDVTTSDTIENCVINSNTGTLAKGAIVKYVARDDGEYDFTVIGTTYDAASHNNYGFLGYNEVASASVAGDIRKIGVDTLASLAGTESFVQVKEGSKVFVINTDKTITELSLEEADDDFTNLTAKAVYGVELLEKVVSTDANTYTAIIIVK